MTKKEYQDLPKDIPSEVRLHQRWKPAFLPEADVGEIGLWLEAVSVLQTKQGTVAQFSLMGETITE